MTNIVCSQTLSRFREVQDRTCIVWLSVSLSLKRVLKGMITQLITTVSPSKEMHILLCFCQDLSSKDTIFVCTLKTLKSIPYGAKVLQVKCQLFLLLFTESMQLVLSWSCLTIWCWLNLHPGRRVLFWDSSQLNLCRNSHLRFIPSQPDIPLMDWFETFHTLFMFFIALYWSATWTIQINWLIRCSCVLLPPHLFRVSSSSCCTANTSLNSYIFRLTYKRFLPPKFQLQTQGLSSMS